MTDAPQQPPPAAPPQPQPAGPPPGAKPDYTMGWLAHLLMLLTGFVGPLIIWLVKKDDDKYAAYHGKQALCWSVAATIVCIAGFIAIGLITLVTAGIGALLFPCFIIIVWAGYLGYGIYAIIQTSKGLPFKYILVADKLCAKEFAEAYPDQAAGQQPPAAAPPAGPPA